MAGDAYDTIERFWRVQDDGDYTATAALFAEDALFVDPLYGTFEGRDAIAAFMAEMNTAVTAVDGVFTLEELAGDHETAWAQWRFDSTNGPRTGVGVYRVRNGQITYYRDYMNPADHG
jgi:ketosteroid isomerase-like protein